MAVSTTSFSQQLHSNCQACHFKAPFLNFCPVCQKGCSLHATILTVTKHALFFFSFVCVVNTEVPNLWYFLGVAKLHGNAALTKQTFSVKLLLLLYYRPRLCLLLLFSLCGILRAKQQTSLSPNPSFNSI